MPRTRRLGGHELVEQLNAVVAQLIKENRKLKRQVDKLTVEMKVKERIGTNRPLRDELFTLTAPAGFAVENLRCDQR